MSDVINSTSRKSVTFTASITGLLILGAERFGADPSSPDNTVKVSVQLDFDDSHDFEGDSYKLPPTPTAESARLMHSVGHALHEARLLVEHSPDVLAALLNGVPEDIAAQFGGRAPCGCDEGEGQPSSETVSDADDPSFDDA